MNESRELPRPDDVFMTHAQMAELYELSTDLADNDFYSRYLLLRFIENGGKYMPTHTEAMLVLNYPIEQAEVTRCKAAGVSIEELAAASEKFGDVSPSEEVLAEMIMGYIDLRCGQGMGAEPAYTEVRRMFDIQFS